ncbi:MAG: class I SAM-dependent methyltransferase [Pirellulales bacterium]|nr:class I SAM-dependent methyltransferase [Pirellulales bacterium]
MSSAAEHNARAWDELVRRGGRHTLPVSDADLANPLASLDSCGWLSEGVAGRRVLCLGAGGGRQSALFAAAGADVTVVDISAAMLALDREVATRRGLALRTVETSMDDLSMLAEASFDLVWQPVSTCYVPDVLAVYRQVACVVTRGGLYVSQHKQPASLQAETHSSLEGVRLAEPYYRSGPLPPAGNTLHRERGTLEYLHRWEDLVGGLCRAGFVLEDLIEPFHGQDSTPGSFAHRSQYVPPYVRLKARRVDRGDAAPTTPPRLWTR